MMDAFMAARKEVTISIFSFLFLVFLALGLGCFYRFPSLERRPMHTDEAILGMKLAEYSQTGHFQYDPKDYHGPALHQTSLLWAKLSGWGQPGTWTEADLRMVAVLCGLCLLVITLLFGDVLGRLGTAMAMLMSAVSPMMVYYSRYFIMEMQLCVLIALTLGCFWRYSQGGGRLWLVLGGCALGFQHATKETFILNVAAALAGWAAARLLVGDFQPAKSRSLRLGSAESKGGRTRAWLWVLVPALVISVASYSGGFRDWKAVQDSVTCYMNYFQRSDGSGHEKPWHYYLTLIFWRKDTLIWTEAMIGGLGIIGMIYAVIGEFKTMSRQAFLIFLSVYTLALITGYSLLSYKTPWCILSAQYALTLLAGVGAAWIWSLLSGRVPRFLYKVLLGVGIWHLCQQTSVTTGMITQIPYEADSRNPYVYSHTSPNLLRLMAEVAKIRQERAVENPAMQVINRDAGWPLPWYWRQLSNVGYQTTPPATLTAPIIIVDTDWLPAIKPLLEGRNYSERGPYVLRPGLLMTLLVEKVKAPVPQPVHPVIVPKSGSDPTTIMPPQGTISVAPTLMPASPVLPGMSGTTQPDRKP